ncbi:MAG: tetratricopeptide repeat protein, partial [Phycisphaerae bacterium]
FYRLQRYGEAAESFRDTIRLDPKHAFGHRNLGVALARLGFNDEALACFRTAIGLLPPSEHHRIPWLMTLTGREDARPEDIARAHRELGQTMARSMPAPRRHPPLSLEHGRRLR